MSAINKWTELLAVVILLLLGVAAILIFAYPNWYSGWISHTASPPSVPSGTSAVPVPSNQIFALNPAAVGGGTQLWTLANVSGVEVGQYVQLTHTSTVIAYEVGYITAVDVLTNQIELSVQAFYGPQNVAYSNWVFTILNATPVISSSTGHSNAQAIMPSAVQSPTSVPMAASTVPATSLPPQTPMPTSAPAPHLTSIPSPIVETSAPMPIVALTSPPTSIPTPPTPALPTPTSAPVQPVGAATPVHWYPLASDYSDLGSGATDAVLQGNPACAAFTTTGWTQSCASGQNPATLLAPNVQETSDFSLCVYSLYTTTTSSFTFFSCSGYPSGNTDCLHLYVLDAEIMVIELNTNGNGNGIGQVSTNAWTHLCLVYTSYIAVLALWFNGVQISKADLLHTSSTYGTPSLAGEPDNGNTPVLGSFRNWRVYSSALTSSQILDIYYSDAPSGYTPVAPPPTSAPTPVSSTGPSSIPANVVWHVVVTIGQSNALGTNSIQSDTPIWPTDVMIQMFCWSVLLCSTPGTFTPAQVTLYNEGNVGFSHTFGNLLLQSLPAGHGVVLMNAADGGTGFNTGEWTTSNTNLTARTLSALQYLTQQLPSQLGGSQVLEAILWHQGEGDAGDNTNHLHDTYCQYLVEYLSPFIDFLRSNLPGASASTPFLNGGLLPYWVSQEATAPPVMSAIYAVNTSRLYTATADSSFIPIYCVQQGSEGPCGELAYRDSSDNVVHFTADQSVQMGYQYFKAYREAQSLTSLVPSSTTAAC